MFLPKQPKFYSHQTLVVCCSCVSVLLLLLHMIAFIMPYWGVFQITSLGISTTVYYGLWSKCTSVDSDRTVCIDWTSSTSSGALKATQFFGVTGVLTAIIAALMFVLMALKNFMWKNFVKVTIVLFLVSAVSNLLGIISFIVTLVDTMDSDWLSWCFYLIVVNTVTCALIGVYILMFTKDKGILFQKRRNLNDNTLPSAPSNLPSSRKIKAFSVHDHEKIDETELQKNKEIIDSKII